MRRLLLIVVLALLASACSVENSSVATTPLIAADDADLTESSSGVEATTASQSDGAPAGDAVAPSVRCQIDGPVLLGRIGLEPDLVVVASSDVFNPLAIIEPFSDVPATLAEGVICVNVEGAGIGSVSCGLAERASGLANVRRTPVRATLTMITADGSETTTMPPVNLWEDCAGAATVKPLDEDLRAAPILETTQASVTATMLGPYVEMLTALGQASQTATEDSCVALANIAEGQRAIGDAVLSALEVDAFWTEPAADHVPTVEQLAAVVAATDRYREVVDPLVASSPDLGAVGEWGQASHERWASFARTAMNHAGRDDDRFPYHYEWMIGVRASTSLNPHEIARVVDATADDRCSQAGDAAVDTALFSPDPAAVTALVADSATPQEPADAKPPAAEHQAAPESESEADAGPEEADEPAEPAEAEAEPGPQQSQTAANDSLAARIAWVAGYVPDRVMNPQAINQSIQLPAGWDEFYGASLSEQDPRSPRALPDPAADLAAWCDALHDAAVKPMATSARGWIGSVSGQEAQILSVVGLYRTVEEAEAGYLRHVRSARECAGHAFVASDGSTSRMRINNSILDGVPVVVTSHDDSLPDSVTLRMRAGTAVVALNIGSVADMNTPAGRADIYEIAMALIEAIEQNI